MSLPSSMADFVPCDHLLQKAFYLQVVSRITSLFILTNLEVNTCHNTLDIKTNIVEGLLKFKIRI